MLALPAELTHAQAPACLAGLLQALSSGGQDQGKGQDQPDAKVVRLDAAPLQTFDSSALAVLLSLHRAAQRAGKSLQIDGLPQRLKDLAGLYGVSPVLFATE